MLFRSRELPPAARSWVQAVVARDHAIINAVQHGSQYTFYMDSPGPQDPAGTQAGNAGA